MATIINIHELTLDGIGRFAIAELDEPYSALGRNALVGLRVLKPEFVHQRYVNPAEHLRSRVAFEITDTDIVLDELFAEDLIPMPFVRPSGKTEPTSVWGMFPLQVESLCGRSQRSDDDGEWYARTSQVHRSMTPRRFKIFQAEANLWMDLQSHNKDYHFSKNDLEAIFEIKGLEPNEFTGSFVENLLSIESKWRRW